jgi:hypothetical protein
LGDADLNHLAEFTKLGFVALLEKAQSFADIHAGLTVVTSCGCSTRIPGYRLKSSTSKVRMLAMAWTFIAAARRNFSVRLKGADHQWGKDPLK